MSGSEVLIAKGLKERMRNLMNDKTYADVEFIVGGSTSEIPVSMKAHKAVLSVNSPVFSAMFSSPLKEAERAIQVTDITPVAFQNMLKFMYTDECTLHTNEEIFDTYRAADKYMVLELKERCYTYIAHIKIKPTKVCNVLENALKFNMSDLENRSCNVIQASTAEVLNSNGFLISKLETVMKILECNVYDVCSEMEVLQAVIAWGEEERTRVGENANLRELIEPLLPNICFGSIHPSSFCDFINKNPNVFTESEAYCILSCLIKPGVVEVPEWCNLSRIRRTTRNLQCSLSFLPELIRFKQTQNSWFNISADELIACLFITHVKLTVVVHSMQLEWKVQTQLPLDVVVHYIATSDYSLISREKFEAPEEVFRIAKKMCILHLRFAKGIEIKPVSSFWIYVKAKFKEKVPIKYQERGVEKHPYLTCVMSNTKLCLPVVSELSFSTVTNEQNNVVYSRKFRTSE